MSKEEKYICIKCKKKKKISEGSFYLNKTQYCCKKCCGDKKDKNKKDKVCEFC